MNKEINKCLQTIFLFSNNKQDTKSFLTLTTFSEVLPIQQQILYESHQLFNQDILNEIESNDSPSIDFFQSELEQHLNTLYKNTKRKNLKDCSSDFEDYKQSAEQSKQNLPTNQDDALNIFNKSLTKIHKKVPSLFQEQLIEYKTMRERIQEKIDSQKKVNNMQVITNRFTNASLSPASRYHSKSPQSRFTKDFQQKFQSIKQSPCKTEMTEGSQKTQTPKKSKIDTTVQIRLDIQKFQASQKKPIESTIKKSQHLRLDSRNLYSRKSKSPTPKKSESQYLIVNLYQKKK